jgi:hypothetical protein
MPSRFNLPHIDISNRAVLRPYQAPQENRGGGSAPRIREEHGRRLQAQLTAAFLAGDSLKTTDDRLEPASGVYLEVELRGGSKVDDLERKRSGVKPAATKAESGQPTTIALFVPDEARPLLEAILRDYTSGPLTPKGQVPQYKPFVEPIESIRQARLETFWTDDLAALPTQPGQEIWWEVWCFKGMEAAVLSAVERLGARAASDDHRLIFPETTVIPVFTSRVTIELMLFATVGISELRRASATPTFFIDDDRESQLQWATILAERTKWPAGDAPAVCLLDTGVNRAHVLIEPALSAVDSTAVVTAWGATDGPEGHGTGMAGLSLHGDLMGPLSDERQLVLTHRLESVKILPPQGFPSTDPKSYGSITQAATALAELRAPTRQRVFCLAVTNLDVSGSRSTTWSAAIDQAAVGKMVGDEEEAPRRLFFISAGNAPAHIERHRILPAEQYPIEDPAQAWNALTVGGYTDKITIDDEGLKGWSPFSAAGELSPFTRTSVTWPQGKAPLKPEIVMESGNRAVNPGGDTVLSADSLALLTTGSDTAAHALVAFSATSAAAAQAARMGAMLSAAYPDMWSETIRALVVHSAEWTGPMVSSLREVGKRERYMLLRRFGYGVPSYERAAASASNHLALVAQNLITPFRSSDGRKFRDCHFYRLPWPKEVLESIGDRDVRLKITLSYFIEPNPGASSAIDPQRYQSHGLRFDLRRKLETVTQFLERVNPLERDDPKQRVETIPDEGWRFGPQSISAGSLHCDEWTGPAIQLAARDIICVKPVMGWWRVRGTLDECNSQTRYALVATLSAPEIEINLHTPIATLVASDIDVEIAFDNDGDDEP